MNTQISNNDGAQSGASLPPRTGSATGWIPIGVQIPPIRKEVLVCQEGVDANARAMILKSGKWKFAKRKAWMVIEASHIKAVTHWWKSSNDTLCREAGQKDAR